jgi:hypothetical protein
MGDQFNALSYAIDRYVAGKGPDKSFVELDEETQQMFLGLNTALFEINRRYSVHMWDKMELLEKKWEKQGKSKDEIILKLKKILPDHMSEKVEAVWAFVKEAQAKGEAVNPSLMKNPH